MDPCLGGHRGPCSVHHMGPYYGDRNLGVVHRGQLGLDNHPYESVQGDYTNLVHRGPLWLALWNKAHLSFGPLHGLAGNLQLSDIHVSHNRIASPEYN